jgi:hypothetical protein
MELGQALIYLYLWELGQGNLEFGINAYNMYLWELQGMPWLLCISTCGHT